MKIVQVIPTLGIGGAEKFVVSLCNEMAEQSHHEIIVCSLYGFENEEYGRLKDHFDRSVTITELGKKKGLDPFIFFRVYRLIRKLKPDVVNTHMGAIYYFFPLLFLYSKTRFFHTIHTMPDQEDRRGFLTTIKRFFIKRSWLNIIALSKLNAENARELYGLTGTRQAENLRQIENGIQPFQPGPDFESAKQEIESLRLNSETRVLTHLGRINPVKNQAMMIEAIRRMETEQKNVILIFLGYASADQTELEKTLFENCPQQVKYLGRRSNIRDFLALSDGFCLSSHYEGCPITLLEALSVGAIPLCTPVGGMPDLVEHSVTGFLSHDVTSESYYELLNDFQSRSTDELSELKKKCIESFNDRFDIATCSEKYLNYYNEKLASQS